jgi:hypothetical protein
MDRVSSVIILVKLLFNWIGGPIVEDLLCLTQNHAPWLNLSPLPLRGYTCEVLSME